MIPEINHILFYFTALFAVSTVFVSKETILMIDLVNKTGQIEYTDLSMARESTGLATVGLEKVTQAIDFDPYFSQMKLTSKKLYKKGNKLNAVLNFSFEGQQELLDLLYFSTDPEGNLVYPVLEFEKLVASNGKLLKEDAFNYVRWDDEIGVIHLTLKYRESKYKQLNAMVSLTEYWEE